MEEIAVKQIKGSLLVNTYIIFEQKAENKLEFHPGLHYLTTLTTQRDMRWRDEKALGHAFKKSNVTTSNAVDCID